MSLSSSSTGSQAMREVISMNFRASGVMYGSMALALAKHWAASCEA